MEFDFQENKHFNNNGDTLKTNIPTLPSNTTYNEFYHNFMMKNLPCLIQNVTTNWESFKNWQINNKPNFNYLNEKYGNCDVTVYDCEERYFNSQKTETTKFKAYIEYWQDLATGTTASNRLKYLKDWHLKNTFQQDNFYEVPIYFASDWLNEYFVHNCKDDYRFVYMGPKETWTPFHSDVFSSFSWSANICGKKKWIFFPPGEENYLRDKLNNLPYDVTKIKHNRNCYELIQSAGEVVFIPSGWHHQVYNLEDTISINHNWVNGCNLNKMWFSICKNLNDVEQEIDDCRDMENYYHHCQVMLNCSFGLDFYQFYDFLKFICLNRVKQLQNISHIVQYNGYVVGKNHLKFDLSAASAVLEEFINHKVLSELDFSNVSVVPEDLFTQIKDML